MNPKVKARLALIEFSAAQVERTEGGVVYRGEKFPGFNKPKRAPAGSSKKFVVLAKKGDQVKKVSYGARGYEDFRQHKDPARRANYLKRSAGIENIRA